MDKLKEVEDRLIIGFDGYSKDKTCLVVAREENSGYRVINEVFDKEAEYIYECLTGVKKQMMRAIKFLSGFTKIIFQI